MKSKDNSKVASKTVKKITVLFIKIVLVKYTDTLKK